MVEIAKSPQLFNPIPNGCVLYLPLWHNELSGGVFSSADDFRLTCTVSGATHVATGRDLDGSDDLITIGNIGTNIKSLSFWIDPETTSESILEEVDDTGLALNAGTMEYTNWDNCFVDGVDSDTVTAAWHNIIVTSTSNIDMTAFRFGLVNATFFDGIVGEITAWTIDIGAGMAKYYYDQTNGRY
uniref:Uncharacterized protein n=1 Tax=viral metagenome TaxID=1070528 RepID=A0A6M3LA42_9ZZZZ